MNAVSSFTKFPSTPHLAVLNGASVRDDKVLSLMERDQFLSHKITVEEKIDGANLGISFDDIGHLRLQNRGSILGAPMTGQWKTLTEWITPRTDRLFDLLTNRYILFGEWCYATHSVHYNRLPEWFVGYDVFDSVESQFVCKSRRDELLTTIGIHGAPCLANGYFSLEELIELLGQSHFGDAPAEGLYLRFDDGNWLAQRAKLVRPDFIQSIEKHWSRGPLRVNRLIEHYPDGVAPGLPTK